MADEDRRPRSFDAFAAARSNDRLRDYSGYRKPSLIEALESSIPGPEQQAVATQALEILEATVNALPYGLRSVFMMREIEEMSTAETAECLGVSEEAVKIRLHRARKLLRRDLHSRVGAVSSQAFRFLGASCSRVVSAVMERIQSTK